jgi:hypothetical protein
MPVGYYEGFIKTRFGKCGMQSSALTARSIGVVQLEAFAACIIFNYLHATEQQFASTMSGSAGIC